MEKIEQWWFENLLREWRAHHINSCSVYICYIFVNVREYLKMKPADQNLLSFKWTVTKAVAPPVASVKTAGAERMLQKIRNLITFQNLNCFIYVLYSKTFEEIINLRALKMQQTSIVDAVLCVDRRSAKHFLDFARENRVAEKRTQNVAQVLLSKVPATQHKPCHNSRILYIQIR